MKNYYRLLLCFKFQEAAPEGLSRIPFGGLRNSNGQQTDQPASRGQSDPRNVASSFATSVPLEDLHPPVRFKFPFLGFS